ncbi:hypothetical protein SH1V18_22480 [Vallitalea longa]|uniref:DegV family protein n=1 Tax=Vallitalea longa TaxID=2936439 RepID=A0A9W5YCE8_9FIRM|nr:DegV family protein [Vallitalea longa]GKX29768.1 hypothetical protein SH1V18_22480 [Vallitalea longa]
MIKIIADSTCDLSPEIIEKFNIGVAPLTINIDEKLYRDKIDISADKFYRIIEELDKEPTTSMPNPSEFLKLYNNAVDEGHTEIICICMSSATSGSYQSAELAKTYFYEENEGSDIRITVIDSKCMSHGSGWLIMKTAIYRDKGIEYDKLVKWIEHFKKQVKHYLTVDDLDHLIKSGRLTNASAFIGKILRIKPIMTMKKGKGSIVAKERGRKRVLSYLINEFNKRVDERYTNFIIIGYTSDIKYAENLKERMIRDTDFKGDIYIMQMGVAVGTHVGLGAVSLFFLEKRSGQAFDNLLVNSMYEFVDKTNDFIDKIKK